MHNISEIFVESFQHASQLKTLVNTFGFTVREETRERDKPCLVFTEKGLLLSFSEGKKNIEVAADFAEGTAQHRRKFGGGKGQLISRAIGLNKKSNLEILDATAGLGRDAFVLACLGAKVTLYERVIPVQALLCNAFQRAEQSAQDNDDEELASILSRMSLSYGDSLELLRDDGEMFDVVYLDPMFPERKKTALVKKEMRAFHDIVGLDGDSDKLLEIAEKRAIYRTVVKRPRHAPCLSSREPTLDYRGKTSRFDVYTYKSLQANLDGI